MRYTLIEDDNEQAFEVRETAPGQITVRPENGGEPVSFDVRFLPGGGLHLLLGGASYDVITRVDGSIVRCALMGRVYTFDIYDDRSLRMMRLEQASGGTFDPIIASPMAGKVIAVEVAVGDVVTRGAPLVVIEAMKMENLIVAPHGGRVEAVDVQAGGAVENGARLLLLSPIEKEGGQ